MINNCYIRVDANNIIGTGHLIRTEIIADQLAAKNTKIIFLYNSIPTTYKNKLENKGYQVIKINNSIDELGQITNITKQTTKNLLIIDSDNPEFYTKEFQLGIINSGTKLMLITFYHQHHFYADFVLNQNIMALSQNYKTEPYTKLFLGPKFVILKNEYREIVKSLEKYKNKGKKHTILLSFGGVDKPDRTSLIYKTLLKFDKYIGKIIIVLGSLYANKPQIEQISKTANIKTEVYQNTPKMPFLIAESDIMFNSGGLTVWEAGALRTLNIIIGFSDREKIGGKFIGENNLGYYLCNYDELNQKNLQKQIENIFNKDNSKIINKLQENIDVFGVQKVIDNIIDG